MAKRKQKGILADAAFREKQQNRRNTSCFPAGKRQKTGEKSIYIQLPCKKRAHSAACAPALSRFRACAAPLPCLYRTTGIRVPTERVARFHPVRRLFAGFSRPVPAFPECKHFATGLPDSRLRKSVSKNRAAPRDGRKYAILAPSGNTLCQIATARPAPHPVSEGCEKKTAYLSRVKEITYICTQ